MTADQLQETIDLLHAIKLQWPGIDLQCVSVCLKPVDPKGGPFMVPVLAHYPSGMFRPGIVRCQNWACEDRWTEAEKEQIDLVLFMNRHGDRVRVGYGVKSNLLVIELTTEHVSEYRERGPSYVKANEDRGVTASCCTG